MWSNFVSTIKQNLDEVAGLTENNKDGDDEENQQRQQQQGDDNDDDDDDEVAERDQQQQEQIEQLQEQTQAFPHARPLQEVQRPVDDDDDDEIVSAAAIVKENPNSNSSQHKNPTESAPIEAQPQPSGQQPTAQTDGDENSNNSNGSEVESLRAQNTRLATAMGDALAQVNSQSDQLALLRSQLDQCHSDLTAANKKNSALLAASNTNSHSNSKISALEQQLSQAQQLVEQYKKEGIEISKQLGRERERAKALAAENVQLEAALASAKSAIETTKADLVAEKGLVLTLRDQVKSDAEEVRQLKLALRESSQHESKAVEEASLAAKRIAETESKEKVQTEQKLREQQQLYSELEHKYEELSAQRSALAMHSRAAILSAEQRVSQLERQVSALSLRADMAESRVIETSTGMSDTVAEWGSRVRRSEQQLEDALSKQAALENSFFNATKEIASLAAQLEASRKQEERRAEQVVSMTEEVNRARRGLQVELAKTAGAQQKLEDVEREMRRQEQQHVAEISRLQNEMLEVARSPMRTAAVASSTVPSPPKNGSGTTAGSAASATSTMSEEERQQRESISRFLQSPTTTNSSGVSGTLQQQQVPSSRVEKELARLSAELRDERHVRADLASKLHKLRLEHDVLLQLHGELLEMVEQKKHG